jgi:DNA polymerase alpha subunit B
LLRQKSFYPIYPPPEQVCIDYEAWNESAQLGTTSPNFFIVSSDLSTFVKEVNGCTCLNTGRLVRGSGFGSYALIQIKPSPTVDEKENSNLNSVIQPVSVTFHKL